MAIIKPDSHLIFMKTQLKITLKGIFVCISAYFFVIFDSPTLQIAESRLNSSLFMTSKSMVSALLALWYPQLWQNVFYVFSKLCNFQSKSIDILSDICSELATFLNARMNEMYWWCMDELRTSTQEAYGTWRKRHEYS